MPQFEFIPGIHAIEARHQGCVATIGTFDGVHRGHKAILSRLQKVACAQNLPSMVLIFEPQPYEFFSKEAAPARITRLRDKVLALRETGIDRVLCIRFDAAFRSLSAQEFIERVLVRALGVRHLEVGDDFRFGCDRVGDFALLQKMGETWGFSVQDTLTLCENDERISSTRVRQLLEHAELAKAEVLLGRGYKVSGRVGHGKKLGRSLGVPTANIHLGRCRAAVSGVFTVEVHEDTAGAVLWRGVANVGVRPTVEGRSTPLLEVHLLDEEADLYGRCLYVTFLHRLRGEQKFESVEALKTQLHHDIAQARLFFTR